MGCSRDLFTERFADRLRSGLMFPLARPERAKHARAIRLLVVDDEPNQLIPLRRRV